jgi:hypothetical protein
LRPSKKQCRPLNNLEIPSFESWENTSYNDHATLLLSLPTESSRVNWHQRATYGWTGQVTANRNGPIGGWSGILRAGPICWTRLSLVVETPKSAESGCLHLELRPRTIKPRHVKIPVDHRTLLNLSLQCRTSILLLLLLEAIGKWLKIGRSMMGRSLGQSHIHAFCIFSQVQAQPTLFNNWSIHPHRIAGDKNGPWRTFRGM